MLVCTNAHTNKLIASNTDLMECVFVLKIVCGPQICDNNDHQRDGSPGVHRGVPHPPSPGCAPHSALILGGVAIDGCLSLSGILGGGGFSNPTMSIYAFAHTTCGFFRSGL